MPTILDILAKTWYVARSPKEENTSQRKGDTAHFGG